MVMCGGGLKREDATQGRDGRGGGGGEGGGAIWYSKITHTYQPSAVKVLYILEGGSFKNYS